MKFLKVSGTPSEIGYSHGKNLAKEIKNNVEITSFMFKKGWKKDWDWIKDFTVSNFNKKIDNDIIEEMKGMVKGASDSGEKLDFEDIFALNATFDIDSYLTSKRKIENAGKVAGGCSSFLVSGTQTADNSYLLAHSTWSNYVLKARYNLFEVIIPNSGYPFAMQTAPGFVFSGTDFYYNSLGIGISETTIDGMKTYNIDGVPIFQRLRKAIQHSRSIEDVLRFLSEQNTGGYANDYLVGDANSHKIASIELGSYNISAHIRESGFFASSNVALAREIREETDIDYSVWSSDNTRYKRLISLLDKNTIDVEYAKTIFSDHYDIELQTDKPGKNSICGHREVEERLDAFDKEPPFYPFGAIDAKIVTGKGALEGYSFFKWGKACDTPFMSELFLKAHPEYEYMRPYISDLISEPWKIIKHGWV